MENRQTLDISWQTILKVFMTGFVLYLLFLARDILVWFFFALIISILLEPAVAFLVRLKVPKVIAVIAVYSAIFGAVGLMVYITAPVFVFELKQFSNNIPTYFQKANPVLNSLGLEVTRNFEEFTKNLITQLEESSGSIIRAITVFFGGVVSTSIIFVFAFYISLANKSTERFLTLLSPKKYEQTILNIFERSQIKVAGWFGARVLACLFVGIMSFIVFILFGVKYSFILALISGALTFIPFIGPLVTAILVLLFVGVSGSWFVAVYIVIALTIIQSIENNFVTPILMKKFLDLPPVLVLIAILIGGKIFGILGVIFVVPVFGIIYEFTKEFLEKRKAVLVD
ncbi:MAG: AI-2E family transporter [Candidatus Staskawiczbacteria bacterium]|nr:AI-2E family transporter [Candidatus Staskawiczbacteria bacterium]